MGILPSQRHLFDLPPDLAYFNCAYMSPLSHRVVEAGHEGLDLKRTPWNIRPADFFASTDRSRAAFARLLGAPATPNDVALVPAASYGMAVAARNLPLAQGQRVLALAEEFPSTILTWRERARATGAELVLLPRPDDLDWTRTVLEAIDERTAVAALPQVHWVDGATLDLARIGARLREVGATLALDLTQSLGALPHDLGRVDPDFLVAACYKWLLGPYSTGLLYVAPRWQQGSPLEENWFGRLNSEDFSALTDYRDGYQPGARRFDVGEPANFALLPAAVAAVEQILEWQIPAISETAGALGDEIVSRGRSVGLTNPAGALRAPHYVALRAPADLPADLAGRLAENRIFISIRGKTWLRITPHVYNEPWEVDRLFEVLDSSFAGVRPVRSAS